MMSYLCFYANVCASCKLGGDIWKMMMFMPPLLTPHVSIELRSHFTGQYITVVGLFGATENLCIQMAVFLVLAFLPNTNDVL